MKTNFKFSNCYKVLAIALIALTSFSACSNDDDNEIKADAYVRIVNASEGSPAQDFYLDSTKLNSSAVAYAESSAYLTTTDGDKLGRFKTSGTAQVNSSANLDIDGGKYYTVYHTGGTSSSASFTTTVDEHVNASANKAKVRFVHLSSAAANKIDLAIQGGAKIISDLAYKSASAYQEVDAATNFQLFTAGSTTAGINLPALNLQAGKVYTVYISGSTAFSITYHVLVDKG
jgi:hypothetical protein